MNKASGGDGILAQLFHILKDDAVKGLHSVCWQIWKTQQWPQNWKSLDFIRISKKDNAKECCNYHTIVTISHASKMLLKVLPAVHQPSKGFSSTSAFQRLQQYISQELPYVQAGFRKGRGTRDQIANIHWVMKKAREFQKKHLLLLY